MSLRHALLGLLVDRSGSGYDLMKLFSTSLGNVWAATQSQLYGELNRLEAAGLIEVVAEGPRGRKEYALTGAGREELHRWLTEKEGEKPQRNEMLLQVFFLSQLTKEQSVEWLLHQADVAAGQLAALTRLDASIDWDGGPISLGGRLALEYGLRLRAMEEEWARWAAGQVIGPASPEGAAEAADTADGS